MYGQHCPRNSYSHYPRRSEEARNPIESVILLGQRPVEWDDPKGPEQVSGELANYDARFVLYDELLHNAYQAYRDFEQKRAATNALQVLFQSIDDFAPDVPSGA